jgi:predicted ribosomally synthesized peptide with SipW-like signal peptide
MKKIMPLIASMVLLVVVSMFAGGGMMAKFSDTETSSGNSFTAGTLDLKVGGKDDPQVVHVTLGDLKPGDGSWHEGTGYPPLSWTVKNVGSLSGKLTIDIKNVVNKENGQTEPEALVDSTTGDLQGELGSKIRIQVYFGGVWVYEEAYISAKNIVPGYGSSPVILGAGAEKTLLINWCISPSVGNEIQSDSVEFDIIFYLEQA